MELQASQRLENNTRASKNQLNEAVRHNQMMESIAHGKGLYLKSYKVGGGINLRMV